MCELLTWIDAQRKFFLLTRPPGSLGRGQKVKYHLISITKSISKILIQNFVCVLTNERYKIFRRVFYSVAWVMPLGWDLGVLKGQIKFRPAVCPLCYLLLNHWTKFNPILVCELLTWMERRWKILAPPPGEGSKGQISFNFNYKVNFRDFYSKLCVCSHKWNVQNILDGFFILSPGSYPWGGTWGYLGAKIKFRPAVCPLCYLLLNHWTKFNPNLVCELLTWMERKVFFFCPALWGPEEGSKGQISFNFNYKVNFKGFYSKLSVCSHKWKIQNISDGIFIM